MANININNADYQRFVEFANAAKDDEVAGIVVNEADMKSLATQSNSMVIRAVKNDKIGKLFRSQDRKDENDAVRVLFKSAIAGVFGGESLIPEDVKKAMQFEDYFQGKPLSARRIKTVIAATLKAIERLEAAEARAKEAADAEHLKQVTKAGVETAMKNLGDRAAKAGVADLVSKVIMACNGDEDLINVIVQRNSINSMLFGGDGSQRKADAVMRRLGGLVKNMAELRACAGEDKRVLDAGVQLLIAIYGKPIPEGLIPKIFDVAQKINIDAIAAISPEATVQELHDAVFGIFKAEERILLESGAGKSADNGGIIEGGDESAAVKCFATTLVFARLDKHQLQNLHAALTGTAMSKLNEAFTRFARMDFTDESYGYGDEVGTRMGQMMDSCNSRILIWQESIESMMGAKASPYAKNWTGDLGFDLKTVYGTYADYAAHTLALEKLHA